jgi:hypothetical protein
LSLPGADAAFRGLAERSERESIAAAYGGDGSYGANPYGGGSGSTRGQIHTGPKGGQFYYNGAGNKQYVKR